MPIYEYQCEAGHRHERLRRYDERDCKSKCPECPGRAKRVISAHHTEPDGIYSHTPNIGDPTEYERRYDDARERTERLK
jgi:putative FmdB family regulatory protein